MQSTGDEVPPPPPDDDAEDSPPPPPPDDPPTDPRTDPRTDFNDAEGETLWKIMQVVNEELMRSDPDDLVPAGSVKDMQLEVLEKVFGVMSKKKRSELVEEDREFIRKRVGSLVWDCLHAPVLRFAKLDRLVCNIGGSRGWAPGSVQAINEDDPSDPTGQNRVPYVVKIDPPDSRLVMVPVDSNEYARPEVCFGQRAGAIWFTRMCLPKAIRKGSQRSHRRFAKGARVACAVEDGTNQYTDWAPGTVQELDHLVEDSDGVRGGPAPYQVLLDNGETVLVHADEHWLVRDLALQPAGPRAAADGTRNLQRMTKRKTEDGWESVDHMTCKVRKVVPDSDSDDDDDDE